MSPVQPARPSKDDEPAPGVSYGLTPVTDRLPRKKKGKRTPSEITPPRTGYVERPNDLPLAGGILPPLRATEKTWFASILYPLRSVDSLAVIGWLTGIFWLFTILVPEYCLGLIADTDDMGTPTLGKLIALISILPVAFLLPFAIFYWLQYLGRVVVASGMGETIPPRTPDRNFGGFLNGISPWFVWLCLGLGVGLLPAVLVQNFGSPSIVWSLALAALALPYILAALLMTFLHDHNLAATPLGVFVALFLLGRSFLLLCVFIAGLFAAGAGIFALALLLRQNYFKTYLVASVGCWAIFIFLSIVAMRVLGNFYHPRHKSLGWVTNRPRWGVTWGI